MNNPLHVVFDLGSFSIKGAVGRVNQNQELEILSIQKNLIQIFLLMNIITKNSQ